MNSIFYDSRMADDERREQLYKGNLFVFSPRKSAVALCELGAHLAEEAFAPLDPREAQDAMPVETYAGILAALKPKFIHHPDAKTLIPQLLEEVGCDPEKLYFD